MSITMCDRVNEPHESHGDCPGAPDFETSANAEQTLGLLRGSDDAIALPYIEAMMQAANIARLCVAQNHVSLVERDRNLPGNIAGISDWVTNSYPPGMPEELVTRRRCDKVAEEAGEVISALGGMYGENPRKGVTGTADDVVKELLDTALAALAATYHLTEDNPVTRLAIHAEQVWERAVRAEQETTLDGPHE